MGIILTARLGEARQGWAGLGMARQGKDSLRGWWISPYSRQGMARQGKAGLGRAWQGKDFNINNHEKAGGTTLTFDIPAIITIYPPASI